MQSTLPGFCAAASLFASHKCTLSVIKNKQLRLFVFFVQPLVFSGRFLLQWNSRTRRTRNGGNGAFFVFRLSLSSRYRLLEVKARKAEKEHYETRTNGGYLCSICLLLMMKKMQDCTWKRCLKRTTTMFSPSVTAKRLSIYSTANISTSFCSIS